MVMAQQAVVAVKMRIPNVLVAADSNLKIFGEFRHEVRFACAIDCPNIVQCFGGATRRDKELARWMVMERLEITLYAAIKENRVQLGNNDPKMYCDIMAGICSAIAYLLTPIHCKPIVHRDMKLNNLMMNIQDGVVKLINFGLAKETLSGVGSTMNIKGTKEWMVPEQLESAGCSVKSDMYAVGLVSTFILLGLTPQ